ncbi:MAG: hypothetical protein KDE63_03375 [Novosphingobium sp.]|nr:hypothetical protein [Novosphingobium sp.]
MRDTTSQDRNHELQSLLEQMRDHPERDWTEARKRVKILREVLQSEGELSGD